MFLRFTVPQPNFLYGLTEEELNPSASFKHKEYQIALLLPGGEPRESSGSNPRCKWYRQANELQFTLTDGEADTQTLARLCSDSARPDLIKVMREITLRVFHVIRNVGCAPELPETLPEEGEVDEQLKKWEPESSTDGNTWIRLIPPDPPTGALALALGLGQHVRAWGGQFPSDAELDLSLWPHIVEMLEDGKEASPEDEFFTNTIGHLRRKNFRLALLESIIGLEIVLTQFLREHLTVVKRLPKRRIDIFLADLDLTARLSAVLDFTVPDAFLKSIDLVLKAVKWRNDITHKSGHLPQGIPDERVREAIYAVLKLARQLAERRDDIRASPETVKIAKALMSTPHMLQPTIWVEPWHRITIKMPFFSPFPSKEEMQAIADEAGRQLKIRDPRFDRDKHLLIRFEDFAGTSLGHFGFGRLLLPVNEEQQEPRP